MKISTDDEDMLGVARLDMGVNVYSFMRCGIMCE